MTGFWHSLARNDGHCDLSRFRCHRRFDTSAKSAQTHDLSHSCFASAIHSYISPHNRSTYMGRWRLWRMGWLLYRR